MESGSSGLYMRLQRPLARACIVVFALVFAGGTLLLALQDPGAAGGLLSLDVLLVAFVGATLVGAEFARVVCGLGDVRASVTAPPPPTPWARLGRVNAYLGIPALLLLIPALLGLLALVGLGLADRLRAAWPALPPRFYLVAATFAVYLLARDRLVAAFTPALRPLDRYFRSLTPTYAVRGRSIFLDLKRKRRGPAGQEPAVVRIDFEELDEVRVLSFGEVGPYLSHQVGPDPDLAARNLSGMVGYYAGQLDRPPVYRDTAHGTRPVLLLKGPELFYLVSIANDEPSAVERAFRDSRST